MKRILILIFIFIISIAYSQQWKYDKDSNSISTQNVKDFSYEFSDIDLNQLEEADLPMADIFCGSDDIFNSAAGFNFSAMRFSPRGMDSKYNRNYLNGVNVNNLERGYGSYNLWSGLSVISRNKEIQNGMQYNDYSFGDIGGAFNIDTKASSYAKGIRLAYSNTNRSYTNRVMLTASTGIMNNGWAFTFSGTRRWAQTGFSSPLTNNFNHAEGTFYDAWSYLFSAEKKFLGNQSLSFTFMGTPTKRASQSAATAEAYEIMENNYYNPSWGYQNGEVRNSNIRKSHQPIAILNYLIDIDPNTSFKTNLSYNFGKSSSTGFNWRDAYDVSPVYYKNLPGYYTTDVLNEMMLEKYANDKNAGQIHWDDIIFANKNSADLKDADGKQVPAIILEGRNDDKKEFNGNIVFNTKISDFKINTGFEHKNYNCRHYNTVEDLLGGDYWVDTDPFAARNYSSNDPRIQNDTRNPNKKVKVGDVYSIDYESNITLSNLWFQTKYSVNNHLDLTFGLTGGYEEMWRTGNMQKGLFPDNSLGDSKKKSFLDYSIKYGIYYKINGNNQFEFNAAYMQKAPNFINVFIAPRKHNGIFDDVKEDNTMTADFSYHFTSPKLKGRFTLYGTSIKNQNEIKSMYNDEKNTFTNFVLSDIQKLNIGLEFGLEYMFTSEFRMTMAAAHSQFKYVNNPTLTIYKDETFEVLSTEKAYFKNYNLSNGPQTALTLGFKYYSSNYWFFSSNINYYANSYVAISPINRTTTYADIYKRKPAEYAEYIKQEKLEPGFTVDVSLGKSWKIDKYFINLSANVMNLLNNQDLVVSGFEQYRADTGGNSKKFPTKYYYLQGINYFLNLTFRF